ncbi:MAG: hypothetical protein AAB437_03395 [Patescibacteria group bacterium]
MKKIIVFLLLMIAFYFSSTLNQASAYNCHVSGTGGSGNNGYKCDVSGCGLSGCLATERRVYNNTSGSSCCASPNSVCEAFTSCLPPTPTPNLTPGTWNCYDSDCMGVSCSGSTTCRGLYPNPCECVLINPQPTNIPIPTRTPTPTPSSSTAPGKPTVSVSCVNTIPTANISWTGSPNPTFGFWVDISESSSFSAFYNKNVTSGNTTNSTGFKGIVPAQDQTLVLQSGKTYFTRVFNGSASVTSDGFTVNACGPSPTIDPNCLCSSDVCSTSCSFDYHSQVTSYTKPPKCILSSSLFLTPPTSSEKNGWCKSLRVKGDSDGNGVVDDFLDYLYYVTVVSGGKVPQNVNPDFNGDGEVGRADLDIYKLTKGIPL